MTTERNARLEATGAWTLAAWGAANSNTKYTTPREICRIPTTETPCPTCQAWRGVGRYIQLAARAIERVWPKSTHPKRRGGAYERQH
jgi:hypothetical protein